MTEEFPPTLKLDAVAYLLNVSKDAIYMWRREGKIRFVKVGGSSRILREDFLKLYYPEREGPYQSPKKLNGQKRNNE